MQECSDVVIYVVCLFKITDFQGLYIIWNIWDILSKQLYKISITGFNPKCYIVFVKETNINN